MTRLSYQDKLKRDGESKLKPIVTKKTRNRFPVTRSLVLLIIGFGGVIWTTYKDLPYTPIFFLIMSGSVFLAMTPSNWDE